MEKIIIASMRRSAGKTSVIVGMAKNLKKKIAYMKPFGDRLVYEEKRLWDYDSAVMADLFNLPKKPEDMSIGFDYSKLKYIYDKEKTHRKLEEFPPDDTDVFFIETGRNLTYGSSVHLDPLYIAKDLKARLFIVVKGNEWSVDDIKFMEKYLDIGEIDFGGIIINQIKDLEDFKLKHLESFEETGVPVLGLLPYNEDLNYFTLDFLAKCLPAKVIAGEEGLDKKVKNIFVGAMYGHEAFRNPLFEKEHRLIITGGDRVDMILGSLNEFTSGIVLTNNIVPPSSIIAQANENQIPLLLSSADTYKIASQIHKIEPLLALGDKTKALMLEELVMTHLNIQDILKA